jgi:hypothetical protein
MAAQGFDDEIWLNNRYQVNVKRDVPVPDGWPEMVHLSIKRIDKGVIHDWRHLQRIKNEIVGPDHEAVELYPSEERLIDTVNQYHLWVLAKPGLRFPFGWDHRLVADSGGNGAKQRPFEEGERPDDCKTGADLDAMLDNIIGTAKEAASDTD